MMIAVEHLRPRLNRQGMRTPGPHYTLNGQSIQYGPQTQDLAVLTNGEIWQTLVHGTSPHGSPVVAIWTAPAAHYRTFLPGTLVEVEEVA